MRNLCIFCWISLSPALIAPAEGIARATDTSVTDEQIDRLIEHLVTILKNRQNAHYELEITGSYRSLTTGEEIQVAHEIFNGTVTDESSHKVTFQTASGLQLEIPRKYIVRLSPPGHFQGESTAYHADGGRTALATLALLTAGVSRYDPVLVSALEFLDHHPMPGTYGRALRASVYAELVLTATGEDERKNWARFLHRDARWLVQSMYDHGGYGYTTDPESSPKSANNNWYDNSNTQFGNLGVWMASVAGYQSSARHWEQVGDYWLEHQNTDGGWGYQTHKPTTMNMTIAGVNSLFIVLDQLGARTAGSYRRYEGIRRNNQTQQFIQNIHRIIDRALVCLAKQGKPVGEPYTQLGIERLGLASGLKYLGGQDWYRLGAEEAMRQYSWESRNTETLGMWLLFLAHGRAPVLFNKLKWGDTNSGWDYYFRDLFNLCRYFNNTYERLHKWQIITDSASLHDLQDAPLLFIAGEARIDLPDETAERIRQYVYAGGTVVGHANLGSDQFVRSFRKRFETLFSETGAEFQKLPPDHPIYHTAFGGPGLEFKHRVPLWGLSDGYREMIILIPVDIAGAWHQALEERYIDFFRLMANLRFYAAPEYDRLPGRLRKHSATVHMGNTSHELTINRPRISPDRGGALTVWETMNGLMSRHYGMKLNIQSDNIQYAPESAPADVLHIAGQGKQAFTQEQLQNIKKYCQSGGMVLIEAIGGNIEFANSALSQLKEQFGDALQKADKDDPLIAGRYARGKPIHDIQFTRSARHIEHPKDHPLLYVLRHEGEIRLIYSPLDISVSANGHFIFGLKGYDAGSARKILRNILLYRQSCISMSDDTSNIESSPNAQE